ncbi:hypothetical protein T440DRAFT_399427, partial [Plenodomus tracheiphilus IPT5]
STYDHRTLKIELPVRSAVLKQCTGGLVVRWVTTGESPLLYVFLSPFFYLVTMAAATLSSHLLGAAKSGHLRAHCDEVLLIVWTRETWHRSVHMTVGQGTCLISPF